MTPLAVPALQNESHMVWTIDSIFCRLLFVNLFNSPSPFSTLHSKQYDYSVNSLKSGHGWVFPPPCGSNLHVAVFTTEATRVRGQERARELSRGVSNITWTHTNVILFGPVAWQRTCSLACSGAVTCFMCEFALQAILSDRFLEWTRAGGST